MGRKEIIKSLRCCITTDRDCQDCIYCDTEGCLSNLLRDAADELETDKQEKYLGGQLVLLNKKIDALLNTGKDWISVKERMPNELDNVLTYSPNGNTHIRINYIYGGSFIFSGSPEFGEVTYWMPLPMPPAVPEGRCCCNCGRFIKENNICGWDGHHVDPEDASRSSCKVWVAKFDDYL